MSLDRCLRVHDTHRKNGLMFKVHLKQKLSSVLVSSQHFEGDSENYVDMMAEKINPKQKIDGRENKKKFQSLQKGTIKLAFLKKKPEPQAVEAPPQEEKEQENEREQDHPEKKLKV